MTNPTLERAARAAAACLMDGPVDPTFSLDDVNGWTQDKAYEIARAVLMAVRSDPPLIKVGFFPYGGMYDIGRIARDGWEAMIDAILGENDDNA